MLDAKLFGIREICDVVLRAKAPQKIGSRIFYTNEPVLYFDTLKTSTFEGAATTVYAQGGRGNARLVAWDGERTVTFTMEDALISPAGLSILTGAGLIEATNDKPIYVHTTDQLQLRDVGTGTLTNPGDCKFTYDTVETDKVTEVEIKLKEEPAAYNVNEDYAYVMVLDSRGVINSEPYIGEITTNSETIKIKKQTKSTATPATWRTENYAPTDIGDIVNGGVILVDYYVAKKTKALQMNITPDKFGGTFYLEASTLWRDEATGLDLPAEFIIPKCKIQSNFTFNLSSSGDPSTFTFTMDAFPDYTRFDKSEKVLASIQVIGADDDDSEYRRIDTKSSDTVDGEGQIVRATTT